MKGAALCCAAQTSLQEWWTYSCNGWESCGQRTVALGPTQRWPPLGRAILPKTTPGLPVSITGLLRVIKAWYHCPTENTENNSERFSMLQSSMESYPQPLLRWLHSPIFPSVHSCVFPSIPQIIPTFLPENLLTPTPQSGSTEPNLWHSLIWYFSFSDYKGNEMWIKCSRRESIKSNLENQWTIFFAYYGKVLFAVFGLLVRSSG